MERGRISTKEVAMKLVDSIVAPERMDPCGDFLGMYLTNRVTGDDKFVTIPA